MKERVSENYKVKVRGYKVPVMVYVDSNLFNKIENARGLAKRSTYIEVALGELLNSTGEIVNVRGGTNEI